MTDRAARRTHAQTGPADQVGLTTVASHQFVTAGLGHGSLVELGIAQATLAAVLALAAAFLKPWGVAQGFLLGAAGVVLVVSGVLLVVWSDPGDAVRIANRQGGSDDERRGGPVTASAGD
jgi:hypothetical protein